MTCPNCRKPDEVKCGYKDGDELSWCVHCGLIRWCSDGLIPREALGRDDHADWCAKHLGLVAFGCAGEAAGEKLWLDPNQKACKAWCGHHYCATAPNLAYVEPGNIEYNSWLASAPSTPEKAGGVSERTHDQEPAASYPPGGVKSPGDTAANSSAETKANAIDMLLVKVHQHLAQALRIPTMPWPEPAAHGHEATGRAIHAAYCAMRFKIMDAIAELTAARCGITAAVIEDTTAALPSPIPHPLPAQANDGGEHG